MLLSLVIYTMRGKKEATVFSS